MSGDGFPTRLGEQSWNVRLRGDAYTILVPDEPIDADELWLAAADEDEGEGFFDASDALPIRTAVTFWWDDGMLAFTESIGVFDTDDRSYISIPPDMDMDRGWLVVAGIEPTGTGAGFAAFLADYLADNGLSYGAEIFGGLPNRIEVHDPAYAPREAVGLAIEAWGAWARKEWNYELPGGGEPGWVDEYLDGSYKMVSN